MLKAFDSFLKVQLSSTSKGSFTKFALSYQNAIDRMTAAGLKFDDANLKILLYSKLPKESYAIVFSKLKDFESLDLVSTSIQAIADQALHIENGSSKANVHAASSEDTTSPEDETKSSAQWPATIGGHRWILKLARQAYFQAKKKPFKENSKLSLSKEDEVDEMNVRIHYLKKQHAAEKAEKSKDISSFDDAKDASFDSILNLVKKKHGTEQAEKLEGWVKRKVNHIMSFLVPPASITTAPESSFVIIDGGADTGVQGGKTSKFLEHTNRSVTITGFDDRKVSEDLKIGTSASKVTTKTGEEVILIANEQIDHSAQDNSIFSVNQLRASNIDVDDCPARYARVGVQGRQSMLLDGDVEIPFVYEKNLILLKAEKPTNDELRRLPIHIITSATPWDPRDPSSSMHPIVWSPKPKGDSGIVDEESHAIIRDRLMNQVGVTYGTSDTNARDDVSVPSLLDRNIESSDSESSVGPGERDVPQCRDEYITDDDSIPSLETRSSHGSFDELSFSSHSEDDILVLDDESLPSEYVLQDNHTLYSNRRPMGLSMAPRDWLGRSTAHYFVDDILTDALGITRFQSHQELLFHAIDSGECEDEEQSNLSLDNNDDVNPINRA